MADLSLEKRAKRIAEAVLYYGDSRGYATRRIAKELAAAEERGRKAGLEEAAEGSSLHRDLSNPQTDQGAPMQHRRQKPRDGTVTRVPQSPTCGGCKESMTAECREGVNNTFVGRLVGEEIHQAFAEFLHKHRGVPDGGYQVSWTLELDGRNPMRVTVQLHPVHDSNPEARNA